MDSVPCINSKQIDSSLQRIVCADDEREEGEIVDEFEYIISSDEEYNMRQRIKELEAKNEELEQIAKISESYNDEYNFADKHISSINSNNNKVFDRSSKHRRNSFDKNERFCKRAPEIPTDVSSISSIELIPTPKKHKRKTKLRRRRNGSKEKRKHKEYTKHTYRDHRQNHHEHQHNRKHTKRHRSRGRDYSIRRKGAAFDTISLESDDSLVNEVLHNNSDSRESLLINRDELKLALARNIKLEFSTANVKTAHAAKDNEDFIQLVDDSQTDTENNNDNPVESDNSSVSLGEQELRLIALKSAYLKKHVKRKQRYAEVAYSPTDFNELFVENMNGVETMDLEDDEIDELNPAAFSPYMSPKQVPSPATTEDEATGTHLSEQEFQRAVNTKPVDMDIATSDESNMDESNMCLETIPLPNQISDSNEQQLSFNYSNHYAMSNTQLGLYMPEMQFEKYADDVLLPVPPPPPPPFTIQSAEIELNINDNAVDNDLEPKESFRLKEYEDNDYEEQQISNNDDEDEEEAEALRALLLAKLQSPKPKPKNAINTTNFKIEQKENTPQYTIATTTAVSSNIQNEVDDADILRTNLLQNITNTKPTEVILKNAVRRFQIKKDALKLDDEVEEEEEIYVDNNNDEAEVEVEETSKPKDDGLQLSNNEQHKLRVKSHKELFGWENFTTVSPMGDMDYRFNNFQCAVPSKDNNFTVSDICIKNAKTNSDAGGAQMHRIRNVVVIKPTENSCTINTKIDSSTDHQNPIVDNTNIPNVENKNDTAAGAIKNSPIVQPNITASEAIAHVDLEPTSFKKTTTDILPALETISTQTPAKSDNIPLLAGAASPNPSLTSQPITNTTKIAETTSKAQLPQAVSNKTLSNNATTALPDRQKPLAASKPLITIAPAPRFTKIIKPNKIINKNPELKRKTIDTDSSISSSLHMPNKRSKSTTAELTNAINNRLITSNDIALLKVPKLVINVRVSETETSEDELDLSTSIDLNSAQQNYYDNASPLSLPIDSASNTPKRVNSPVNEDNGSNATAATTTTTTTTKTTPACVIQNLSFEEKLNTFLRSVRSQVDQNLKPTEITTNVATTTSQTIAAQLSKLTPKKTSSPLAIKSITTPLAVRHLPAASQQEYRRLLHRMNMLEKQKQAKSTTDRDNTENIASTLSVAGGNTSKEATIQTKKTLIRQVLVKNTENINTSMKLATTTTAPPLISAGKIVNATAEAAQTLETSKAHVLTSYENAFQRIGAGIKANLDKSIALVEDAKKTKIAKLRFEKRIEELRAELKDIEHKHKQEQQKMSKIYPDICDSNEKLITLKQKHMKFKKAAIKLGTSLQGEDYRLNYALKDELKLKSMHLASEIKFVNSLKYCDIVKLDSTTQTRRVGHSDRDAQSVAQKQCTDATGTTKHLDVPAGVNDEAQTVQQQKPEKEDQQQQPSEIDKQDGLMLACTKGVVLPADAAMSYISPLAFKNRKSKLDPFATVCPYELMGECKDADCNYLHLNNFKIAYHEND